MPVTRDRPEPPTYLERLLEEGLLTPMRDEVHMKHFPPSGPIPAEEEEYV